MSEGVSYRILDILFVLDTTWSMDETDKNGVSIIDRMNDLVKKMMEGIITDSLISEEAEIAFLTFADDITLETAFCRPEQFMDRAKMNADFVPIQPQCRKMKVNLKGCKMADYRGATNIYWIPQFTTVEAGTSSRIGRAVIYAINKLFAERERQEREKGDVKFYAPVMVLITDGAPPTRDGRNTMDPKEEQEAIRLVYDHCFSTGNARNLVYPVICGIGDEQVERHLSQYSKGYLKGFQHIDKVDQSKGFEELIKKIGSSITNSIALNDERTYRSYAQQKVAKDEPPRKGKTENYRGECNYSLNEMHNDEDDEY